MKRTLLILLCALAVFCFAACGGNESAGKIKQPDQIDTAALLDTLINEFNAGAGEKYCSEPFENAYLFDDDILAGKYGDLVSDYPDPETMVRYCAFFSDEPYGPEFGVFVFAAETDAADMQKYVENRIAALKRNAKNYPSVDTSLIDSAYAAARGCVFYYCALNDTDKRFEKTVLDAVTESE
ncbi:MAG: hypothetical protein IJL41_04870 [Clostridia bacterium]|nr:hypothetical protein [Clostridia bacterium]